MSTDPLSTRPEISVIVPHYEQHDMLAACLDSLVRQSLPLSNFEVIVVDNGSSADLSGLAGQYPDFRFLRENRKGAAHARNCGMAAASGENFAFIDADCVADSNWLQSGLAALRASDLVGGEVLVTTNSTENITGVEAFECVFAFHQRSYINRKHFSVTANLFATRKAAELIGPFKNGVSEDVDWCLRARALGFRLAFNDTSIISHPARRNWDELKAKWERLITERWNGFGGHGLFRQCKWTGLAVATAMSAAPHLFAVMFSNRISGFGNRLAAAGVLARIRFWRASRMLAQR